MAGGDEPVTLPLTRTDRRTLAGFAALACILLLLGGAFGGLFAEAMRGESSGFSLDAYLLRVAGFTLFQAALSTLVSVFPAILAARALYRHATFPGRGLILRLFAVPLALPAIVAALGVLAVFGRAGLLAPLLSTAAGEPWTGIYGLSGILVAHAFFNLPLAARLLLGSLEAIPSDAERLASQLGLPAWARFRLLELPALRQSLPGAAGLVFMLCVTSFTVVLTLGGGPGATTLEVAIYQALRFDFDPGRGLVLTLAQIGLTLGAVLVLSRLGSNTAAEANLSVSRRLPAPAGLAERLFNGAVLGCALLFVAGPMLAVLWAGLKADLARLATESAVLRATGTSLLLASGSALLSVFAAWSLAAAHAAAMPSRSPGWRRKLFDTGAGFVLVMPPVVIGAGWFLLLRQTDALWAAAPALVLAVNAVMAVPFATRAIRPAHDAAAAKHDRLCASLGMRGWNRFRLIDGPVLRKPAATALAFAAALSLGDLGVIALFGSDSVQTLPYLLLARMGSYRTADAAGLALFLGLLCLALMLLADIGGARRR